MTINPPDVVSETAPWSIVASADQTFAFTGANAVQVIDAGAGGDTFATVVTTSNGGDVSASEADGAEVSDSGTTSLTISGTLSQVNAALLTLSYENAAAGSDTVTVTTSDLANESSAVASIGVTINPPDVVSETAPWSIVASADQTFAFTGANAVQVIDAGAGGDTFATVVTTSNGGDVSASEADGAEVSDSGTTSLTISGTLSQVNAALLTLSYENAAAGSDTVTVTTSDLANESSAVASIGVTINPPDVVSETAPWSIVASADQTFAFTGANAVQVIDAGAGGDTFATVVTTSNGGDVSASEADGAEVSDSGTTSLTISGTLSQVNAALLTLSYENAAAGSDTVTVTTSDPNASNSPVTESFEVTVNWTNVSIATFQANKASLDATPGGFAITDIAADVSAALNQLDDPNIHSITISDNEPIALTVAQLAGDATAIGKLQNAKGTPYQLAVSDTEADITAALNGLNGSNIASITVSDNAPIGVDIAQLTSDATAISKLQNSDGAPYQLAVTDTGANISANLAAIDTLIEEARVSSLTTTNLTGQAYSSYEQLYNDGVFSGTNYFYTDVTGEPYSSYEYDYSASNAVIGSKFYYTGITGQAYTAEEVDYNGAGQLTRTAFTGLTDPAYSAYQYNYVGGVFAGSQFTFTTVPTGATYSSYEIDYDQAGNFTGDQFFFTNIQGQLFTGEEVSLDASGALSSVLLTGIVDQAYSSLELDYSAGTYEGYQAFYTGITGQSYTSEEVDVSAGGQLEKVVYSGMTATPYSSVEADYSGGALADLIYDFTNVTGASYYSDQVEDNLSGAQLQVTLDLNSGGHDLVALTGGQTLTSLGDDTMVGSTTGSTTFVLNAVYGADTIANLTSSDTVSMPTSEFASFATLSGVASFGTGAAVIKAGDGDTLTLDGITTSAQLKSLSGDFTFHS